MRNVIAAAMVVAMKLSAQQQDHLEDVTLRITSANVPASILYSTRTKVSGILRQVGVHVIWKSAGAPHLIHECSIQAVDISDIDIQIQDRSQPDDHPGALAYSLPFNKAGNRVVIFYEGPRDEQCTVVTERRPGPLAACASSHTCWADPSMLSSYAMNS